MGNGIRCEECEMAVHHNNKSGRLSHWDTKKASTAGWFLSGMVTHGVPAMFLNGWLAGDVSKPQLRISGKHFTPKLDKLASDVLNFI